MTVLPFFAAAASYLPSNPFSKAQSEQNSTKPAQVSFLCLPADPEQLPAWAELQSGNSRLTELSFNKSTSSFDVKNGVGTYALTQVVEEIEVLVKGLRFWDPKFQLPAKDCLIKIITPIYSQLTTQQEGRSMAEKAKLLVQDRIFNREKATPFIEKIKGLLTTLVATPAAPTQA